MSCEICGGDNLMLLGALGLRTHFRCRDCGMDSSAAVADKKFDFSDFSEEEDTIPGRKESLADVMETVATSARPTVRLRPHLKGAL